MSQPDWNSLHHALGSAGDIPAFLETLASKGSQKSREFGVAFLEFRARLVSATGFYDAQEPAVAALLDLADRQGDPADRSATLVTLALDILTLGTVDELPFGLDLRDDELHCRYANPPAAAVYRVFAEHIPQVVAWLGAPQAPLRGVAARVLLHLADPAAASLPQLVAAIERETDALALAQMLHCLGVFIRRTGRTDLRSVVEGRRTPDRPVAVQVGAWTGQLAFDPSAPISEAVRLFVELVADVDVRWPSGSRPRFDRHLVACVAAACGAEQTDALLMAALEGLIAAIQDQHELHSCLEHVLKLLIPRAFPEARSYALREDFTPYQLELLDRLSRTLQAAVEANPCEHQGFPLGDVPGHPWVLRRWLELDPPGPLNQRMDFMVPEARQEPICIDAGTYRWPVWKVLLVAKQQDQPARLIAERFSPRQVLDLHADMAELKQAPIGGYTRLEALPPLLETLRAAGPEATIWAVELAERMLSAPESRLTRLNDVVGVHKGEKNWFGNALLLPIVWSLPEDAVLDPRYDVLVNAVASEGKSTEVHRQVMKRIPLERREAIFLRAAEKTPYYITNWLASTLDLCPTADFTKLMLEAIDGKHGLPHSKPLDHLSHDAKRALRALIQSGARNLVVAEVVLSYKPAIAELRTELNKVRKKLDRGQKAVKAARPARQPKPRAAPKPPAKGVWFTPPCAVHPFSIDQLGPVQRQQWRGQLEQVFSEGEDFWEYYRGFRDGKPVYDAWTNTDGGYFFAADTTKDAGIIMIQGGCTWEDDPEKDDPLLQEIEAALKKARRFSKGDFEAYWEDYRRRKEQADAAVLTGHAAKEEKRPLKKRPLKKKPLKKKPLKKKPLKKR